MLCKKGELQAWHRYFIHPPTPPRVQHTSYSAAPGYLNYSYRMLKVGLQTSRLQQTWHPQWLKISSLSDVFPSLEHMAVWRGHIRWIDRVFKHFKMQISQLPLCNEQACVRSRPGEMTLLLTACRAAWDHCLLHFVQGRCVLACCNCCTLSEVVDEQYPIFVPENRCRYLGGWLLC